MTDRTSPIPLLGSESPSAFPFSRIRRLPPLSRRRFLAATGAAASSLAFQPARSAGVALEIADFEKLVPRDKKLGSTWIASLTARGEPETYRRHELDHVGMPVGGIACGQLYLTGDGRLAYWDIFRPATTTDYDGKIWAGSKYAQPAPPRFPLEQGFALKVVRSDQTRTLSIDRRGFPEIVFRGEYPVARVRYGHPDLGIAVELEAFSPFIPLRLEDSCLPATVLTYTVRNTGTEAAGVAIAGWLENAVCPGAARDLPVRRRTRLQKSPEATTLLCLAESVPAPGTTTTTATATATGARSTPSPDTRPENIPGFGSLALSLVGEPGRTAGSTHVGAAPSAADVFARIADAHGGGDRFVSLDERSCGAITREVLLAPGEEATFTWVVSWWFPYYGRVSGEMSAITDIGKLRRHYATRFDSAEAVARHVVENLTRLAGETRLWNATWYDSTLPHWFLDRTFVAANCLATQTLHRFDNGRWWGWEGVDCCPGTCQHVWQYAQAAARLFPEMERDWRERVDFGLAWRDNGAIDYRSESGRDVAHDGFCGTLIRVLREHQMSSDPHFLTRIWPRVRKSIEFILAEDKDADGLLEGRQFNTLDAAWYGPMAWISSLYLAALSAGAEMAREMGDQALAERCLRVVDAGRANVVTQLFNGEYFIHRPPDFKHTNTNDGCHIDQLFGQSLAFQVGLPRVVPEKETIAALRSLWRYNFAPDIGLYRDGMKPVLPSGRWYAMPGEAGLLMCTWPRGGADKASGGGNPTFVGYFIECMTGFEYQVAAHMVWEGLVTEGLAVTRAIHDRYAAAKRNPYNEIECSDHYSRAMMSYGVFLAACGFEHHGPNGYIGFDPRLGSEDFRCPFTSAFGWGTYHQRRSGTDQRHELAPKWGRLEVRSLGFSVAPGAQAKAVEARLAAKTLPATIQQQGTRVKVTLPVTAIVPTNEVLEIRLHLA